MARFRGTITIPGNDVTTFNSRMLSPVQGNIGDAIGERQSHTFENNFRIDVTVLVRPGHEADLCAYLYDQTGEPIQELHDIPGELDQDYSFEDDNDTYTLCIKRGAHNTVDEHDKQHYVTHGGVRCLFCEADDIHGGQIDIDAGVASQKVHCCACDASWVDQYRLIDVSDLEAPPADTAR